MQKAKSPMRIGLMIVACVFLFNPNLTVFDLLPDFIGYLLICLAFSRWADLNETMGGALALFRKMILVDLGKYLAILWIFGMSVPSERNSSILLWTFVFSVLELIFLLPAYSKLFAGIVELGYFYPNESILTTEYTKSNRIKKSRTEKIRNLTVGFVMVKAVLTALPEFADLTNASYDEMSGTVNLYKYIGLMRAMATIPVLIVGIVWLFRAIGYFRRLNRDEQLLAAMEERYEQTVLPKVGLFARRNLRIAGAVLTVALVLTLDFRLEGQNFLPDCLAAIALCVAVVFFHKLNREGKSWRTVTMSLSCAYGVIALIAAVLEARFHERYHLSSLIKNVEAMQHYNSMVAFHILKLLLFLATLAAILWQLRKTIRIHTGYVVGREHHSENEAEMIQALHGELDQTLLYVAIFAVLYAIADLCYDIFVATYPWVSLVPLVFGVLTVGFSVRALSRIADAVETKYMLE